MLRGLIYLILLQITGDTIAHLFSLPIPGAVIGMVLLLFILIAKGGISEPLLQTSQTLFPLLPLLLIPASVGVVAYLDLLEKEWIGIIAALVLSLVASFLITPFIFQRLIQITQQSK